MSDLAIEIWDHSGTKKISATVAGDVAVERILVVLVDRLSLPKLAPTGEFMSYKLIHRQRGEQLHDDRSLMEQDVQAGDVLRIVSEITAG
ncbi:MAG: EsaB/YukD family protein [Geminicoccaceae bacterium]